MNERGSKRGRIWKTRMRASAVPLQAELHRERRSDTDVCCVCSKGAVESQAHMLVECTAYRHERLAMFVALECILGDEQCSKQWSSADELSCWLLSNEQRDGPIRRRRVNEGEGRFPHSSMLPLLFDPSCWRINHDRFIFCAYLFIVSAYIHVEFLL